MERVIGSGFDDTYTADGSFTAQYGSFNEFQGGAGDDTVTGNGNTRVGYLDAGIGGVTVDLLAGTGSGDGVGTDTFTGVNQVRGSNFDDQIFGSDGGGFESFRGQAGNDLIDGRGGDQDRADYANSTGSVIVNLSAITQFGVAAGTAQDGFGTIDTLVDIERARGSRSADDILIGSDGNNQLRGEHGNDQLIGGGGDDILRGGNDDDTLDGGSGNDNLRGDSGNDTLTGGSGNDFIQGGDGNDILNAVSGNNDLRGGSGDDIINGGTDHDFIVGDAGNDTIDGGTGSGTVSYKDEATGGISVSGTNGALDYIVVGDVSVGSDTLINITYVEGTNFNDTFVGGDQGDRFDPLGGADSIDGGAGIDQLRYLTMDLGPGDLGVTITFTGTNSGFAIDSSGSTDTFVNIENIMGSQGNDVITMGDGNDTVFFTHGDDTVDGGLGTDTVNLTGLFPFPTSTVVDLTAGIVDDGVGGTDVISNFENVFGSDANDTIIGDVDGNFLSGGFNGDDRLEGRGGFDVLFGGDGNDTAVYSGQSGDYVVTDLGNGSISVTDANISDGDDGTDTVTAVELFEFADQTLTLAQLLNPGINTITGTNGADSLDGTAGADLIQGLDGIDTLSGLGGDDIIEAGSGNDLMIGGAGNDHLIGGGTGFNAGTTAQVDFNQADYRSASGTITVTLSSSSSATGDASVGTDTLTFVESVIGSNFDDTFVADGTFSGQYGQFTNFQGMGGDDHITGNGRTRTDYSLADDGVTVDLDLGTAFGTAIGDIANVGTDTLVNVSRVSGSQFDDVISGTNGGGFEQFRGRGGNDIIDGRGGDFDQADYASAPGAVIVNLSSVTQFGVAAGTALDGYGTVDTLSNIEQVRGSRDNGDILIASDAGNRIEGEAGDDTLIGGAGDDQLEGDAGNDTLLGNSGRDTLLGGDGDDHIDMGSGGDTATGGAGNDFITGGFGGSGAFNTASYVTASGAVSVLLQGTTGTVTGDASVGTDTLGVVDRVLGSNFDDTFTANGTWQGSQFSAFGGSPSGGFNEFRGGGGNDTIIGSSYTRIAFDDAGPGGVTVDFTTGTAIGDGVGTDTFIGVNQVRGSNFDDTVLGSAQDESIRMRGGNDTIDGGGGIDRLRYTSTSGDQVIDLGTDNQTIAVTIQDGFGGTDTVIRMEDIRAGSGNDFLAGDINANQIRGENGNDIIDGRGGDDDLRGGNGDDTITGGDGNDNMNGGSGNDTLTGGDGGDVMRGESGDDHLLGGDGFDFMVGGAGNDIIDGGTDDFNIAYYADDPGSVVINLSDIVQFGAAAKTVLDGFGGTDTLVNINIVNGSNFDDQIVGSDRTDVGEIFHGEGGNDFIDGAGGFDNLDYFNSTDGVTVDLGSQGVGQFISASQGTDTFLNMEGVASSFHDDVLNGSIGDEYFEARGGNDTISAGGGADNILGGDGDDLFDFNTGDGADRIQDFQAGAGSDDVIDLVGLASLNSLTDVQNNATDTVNGALIDGGNGDTIFLDNVLVSQLHDDDFLF